MADVKEEATTQQPPTVDEMFKDEGEQKSGERVLRMPPQTGPMSNVAWEGFCKGELLNFLIRYSLQKITVDDGAGKGCKISINKNGEYKVQVTLAETM